MPGGVDVKPCVLGVKTILTISRPWMLSLEYHGYQAFLDVDVSLGVKRYWVSSFEYQVLGSSDLGCQTILIISRPWC